MQSLLPATDQKPHRISGELLLGLTVGGYVIVSLALYCFGYGLIRRSAIDDVPPFRPYSADPGFFFLLVPGVLIGALSYLQIIGRKLFKQPPNLKRIRVALWFNALGSLGLCLTIALHATPDTGYGFFDAYYQLTALLATLIFIVLGALISAFNLLAGLIAS